MNPPTAEPTASYVNVVAHADDDILFLNPDLANAITAGRPNATIFLTAGEATRPAGPGRPGDPPCEECKDDDELDREDYARCRQLGARAAHARMAGVADRWTEELVVLAFGDRRFTVEVHTLDARPDLRLVFLDLPEFGDVSQDVTVPDGSGNSPPELLGASLNHLWSDRRGSRTIVPSGTRLYGPDTRTWYPDRAHLVGVLRELFARLRPTVVRTLDADPDPRYENPEWMHDHCDHVICARFTTEAVRGYDGPDGRPVTRLAPYRAYNTQYLQVNLDDTRRKAKKEVFESYDRWDVGTSTGDPYLAWTKRMVHRHATGTTWAGVNLDGRPQVFSVQGNRLVTWWRKSSGRWSDPLVHEVPGPLAPGVSVAANEDGRLQVFALRLDDHEIVSAWQVKPNGAFTGWAALGNPNRGGDLAGQVSAPVAGLTSDGLIHVFVKNGGSGLSVLAQVEPNGAFAGTWEDARGWGLQEGVAVGLDRSGGVDVFGYATDNGIGRIRRWSAPSQGRGKAIGPFTPQPDLVSFEPAGPPSTARSHDLRQDVFYRLAENREGDRAGSVGHTWQLPDGGWSTRPETISGQGGVGAPAASDAPRPPLRDGRMDVFTANRGGGVSVVRQVAPDGGFAPDWTDLRGFVVGQPATAVDPTGLVSVFGLTDDGGVVVSSEPAAKEGARRTRTFSGWIRLTAP
ncbi:PIG-L family deacetylase [Saccharothrix lopnurensis]|uniref:PIG-L family deacetylase n=1 Tax=Saccharothrix lopnurensis TaxID=1670621 RepID=A0ABW1P8L7_9PSEU